MFTGIYFGTDGLRGVAGEKLTAEIAYHTGRFLGSYFSRGGKKCRVVIGKDTRRSSYMLECSLVAGLTCSGADAYIMHVTTTPSVSYITRTDGFDCGIMISASHNRFCDNGIKLIGAGGEKLDEAVIAQLEDYLDNPCALPRASGGDIGASFDYVCGRNRYIGHLISLSACSFKRYRVGLDCANGSAWQIAKPVFDALGARTVTLGCTPDGCNVNSGCGSTSPEGLCRLVREHSLDCGFAFDGDADRCIAVDEGGNVVDGDGIMYILACRMKQLGELNGCGIVATVMSNSALDEALRAREIKVERTRVGDRFVYAQMCRSGAALGGEQSGHIIIGKYGASGDGLVTAIKVLECAAERGVGISSLLQGYVPYPQFTLSLSVSDRNAPFRAGIEAVAERIAKDFNCMRVNVRPSGTEEVVRIMAEGGDCEKCVREIARYLGDI